PGGAFDDREHAGDARAAGNTQDVLAFLGVKRRAAKRTEDIDRAARYVVPEQPVRERSSGLLLDHEDESVDLAAKVDHRVGSSTFDLGGFEHDELARLEAHRARQSKLEMEHVAREFAQRVNVGGSLLRQGVTSRPRHNPGGDAPATVAARARLAHEDIAFVAL